MSLMIVIIVIKGTIYMSLTTQQQGLSLFQTKAFEKLWKIKEIFIEKRPNKDQ